MNKQDEQRRRHGPWRRWSLPALLAIAALGALAIAGCGGSSGGSDTASAETSSSSSGSGEAGNGPGGFQLSDEQRECLKEQGVEMPEFGQGGPQGGEGPPSGEMPAYGEGPPSGGEPPQGAPGGAGNEEMQAAMEACGVELPAGGPNGANGGPPNTNSASFRKSVKEYVACMDENGYELPEPDFSGEGAVFDESEVDRESPKFEKANSQCQSLLGGGGSEESGQAG